MKPIPGLNHKIHGPDERLQRAAVGFSCSFQGPHTCRSNSNHPATTSGYRIHDALVHFNPLTVQLQFCEVFHLNRPKCSKTNMQSNACELDPLSLQSSEQFVAEMKTCRGRGNSAAVGASSDRGTGSRVRGGG